MLDIDKLLLRASQLAYPQTMLRVHGDIEGIAFFPGGRGLWHSEKSFADKSVMILGQDFDCETNHKISLEKGRESIKSNPTWRNLLAFLKEAGIGPEECFFTNAIMGVRKGSNGVGKSPAFKDKQFIKECQQFFLYQLELQKPKIILVLGKYTAEFLSPVAEQLYDWKRMTNFIKIDEAGLQVKEDVLFNNGMTASLALLTHPSYRLVNVKRRKFRSVEGNSAEIKMVQSIL